jgi:hypothetical protein
MAGVTDDELTDRWEAGKVFAGGITHEQHLRIAWVLHKRHGRTAAKRRLASGTRHACERHGHPEKFYPGLTDRWASAVSDTIETYGPESSPATFLARHPQLSHSDLFERPASPE